MQTNIGNMYNEYLWIGILCKRKEKKSAHKLKARKKVQQHLVLIIEQLKFSTSTKKPDTFNLCCTHVFLTLTNQCLWQRQLISGRYLLPHIFNQKNKKYINKKLVKRMVLNHRSLSFATESNESLTTVWSAVLKLLHRDKRC